MTDRLLQSNPVPRLRMRMDELEHGDLIESTTR